LVFSFDGFVKSSDIRVVQPLHQSDLSPNSFLPLDVLDFFLFVDLQGYFLVELFVHPDPYDSIGSLSNLLTNDVIGHAVLVRKYNLIGLRLLALDLARRRLLGLLCLLPAGQGRLVLRFGISGSLFSLSCLLLLASPDLDLVSHFAIFRAKGSRCRSVPVPLSSACVKHRRSIRLNVVNLRLEKSTLWVSLR
jgi:hypothetical protein